MIPGSELQAVKPCTDTAHTFSRLGPCTCISTWLIVSHFASGIVSYLRVVRRVCDEGVSSVPAQTFHRKQAIIGRWQKLPRRLIGVSALPCETENMEIASFHLNVVCFFASKHTKHIKTITYGHGQTILHWWDDQLNAADMINTGHKASSIWYAHSRRSPCLPWYRAPCQLWESFSANVGIYI